jgi:murein L,D-transpeptidase YcbB/YkuD
LEQPLRSRESCRGRNDPFDYFFDGEAAQSLSDSYSFAGVVLKVFYDKVAATGMKSLFGKLKSSYSNQVIQIRDSETILSTMTGVSGIESDALLHPGKNAQSFAQATAGLVRPDYGAEGDAILADYILHQIPSYIVGDDGAPVPSVSTAAPAGLAATSSTAVKNQKAGNCPILSRNLARGAKGADVRSLQEYLISLGLLANDSATGTFGPLTAKTLQIWQKGKGLPATGTVGPMTRAEIAKSCGK